MKSKNIKYVFSALIFICILIGIYVNKKQQDNFYSSIYNVTNEDFYTACKLAERQGTPQDKVDKCCRDALRTSDAKYQRALSGTPRSDDECILYDSPSENPTLCNSIDTCKNDKSPTGCPGWADVPDCAGPGFRSHCPTSCCGL
jgi:hypothetical protein